MGIESRKCDSVAISEAQLILAEKRTSLAVIRTGIVVLALPLSVLSVLIAASRYYDVLHVLHFIVPVGLLCAVLVLFDGYLIIHSIQRMRHYDRLIHDIKSQHNVIGPFID